MSLNSPLTVRVNDGTTDKVVTGDTTGLKFTKVANGGHQVCSFKMNLPRNTFTDLGPADRCWVYDKRTGATVFGAAYLENPTPVDGPAGQSWDVQAYGGMALANDETRALIYIDQRLDDWITEAIALKSSGADTYVDDDNKPGHKLQFNPGQVVAAPDVAAMVDYVSTRYGMRVGGVSFGVRSGKDDTGYRVYVADASQEFIVGDFYRITTGYITSELFTGDYWSPAPDWIAVRLRRTDGATSISDDLTWTIVKDMSIIGQRVNRFGAPLSGAAALGSTRQVVASQVVEDLLGRMLTFCDPATARVDSTSFAIQQLVYSDGATSAAVLGDLATFEPDMRWGIGSDDPATGKHKFWYATWDTAPRYVVSVNDGFRQTGSDSDLCNRIAVTWADATGAPQVTVVTAASLGLVGIGLPVDALGTRVKDADPVPLPDGQGSLANAQQVGAAVLRDKISPPLSGTVTVHRPIMDLLTGSTVMPWELEPGYPVLVREPGYTIRCTQVDYDDDSVSATLTLGYPQLTVQQRVARLGAA